MTLDEQIDRIFRNYDNIASPGCAVAVVHQGQTVMARGFGSANLEYGVPITPRTVFHVASVSKQFTAMAMVLLAQTGAISLDDDVHRYVPELADFGAPVTIRQLLQHTSGLRDQWDLLTLAGWRMDDVITTQDVLDLLVRQRDLNFPPGSEYLYSNSGYTLAALIVERVSGQPLRQFARARIFDPLGMRATHFHDDHTELVPGRAYSYEPAEGGGFRHAVLSYATVGPSSLFTTVEDLARWIDNFRTGRVGGQAALEELQRPGTLTSGEPIAYGLGVALHTFRGWRVVEHSGADAGFRSHLLRLPEADLSVIILGNVSTARPGRLARQVAACYLAEVGLARAEASAREEPPPDGGVPADDLEAYTGLYYNHQRRESQRITQRDGQLVWQVGSGIALTPIARGHFAAWEYPGLEVHFRPESVPAEMAIVEAGLPPVLFTRTTPVPDGRLADYAGTYYSPELDVTYRVTLNAGRLEVCRRKYGAATLEPTVPQGFTAGSTDYFFDRDAGNRATGFRLTTGRVRNLRFVRAA